MAKKKSLLLIFWKCFYYEFFFRRGIHSIQGYSTKGREILESNIFEEKETLDVQGVAPSCVLPDQELPNLRNALSDLTSQIKDLGNKFFFREINFHANFHENDFIFNWHIGIFFGRLLLCLKLTKYILFLATRLLKCLALGLQIDPNEFLQQHSGILNCDDDVDNASAIRLLHYPPVNKKFVQQNSADSKITRCGKHTDYGGLTLLFQVYSTIIQIDWNQNQLHQVKIFWGALIISGSSRRPLGGGRRKSDFDFALGFSFIV